MRVGLLGGSFNPAHKGHVHISLIAMQVMQLDCVWWLVTPQNPFKSRADMRPFDERFAQCKAIANHPRILVSDIENKLHSNRTLPTVRALKAHYPGTAFAWITGMDIAQEMHRWHRWRDLLNEISMVHMCRPPAHSVIRAAPLRLIDTQHHIHPPHPARYRLRANTSYWILQKKMMDISSSTLRQLAESPKSA
jgi:nicotinate-nucleotide adenylyltransferase